MAFGRGILAGACVGALALAGLSACGAEEHANDLRPAPPVRVSVAVTDSAITVTPDRIGVGPEEAKIIPQNKGQKQPNIPGDKVPLNVVFVSANLTHDEGKLQVTGPRTATSGALVADGNNLFQIGLPTGIYKISAKGIPGAEPATLAVGPYRASSQNDLLLP
jgi:hypothetical protein